MRKLMIMMACVFCYVQLQAQGYQLTIQSKQYTGGTAKLAHYYMGSSVFLDDSAQFNPQGVAVFKGKEALPGGIYVVLLPGSSQPHFDILVDKGQQQFTILPDTTDLQGKTTFKNSPANDLFVAYNKFLLKEIAPINKEIMGKLAAHTSADSAAARPLQQDLNKKLTEYRKGVVEKNPQTLLAAIFKTMKEVDVPPTPPGADSSFGYWYYRTHFWDNTDFGDGRLVRTPTFESKLKRYFTQLIPQEPDSVNEAADMLIEKSRKDKEMFRFMVTWVAYTYESSPYMGMDAVFVHVVEKYYVNGDATWLTDDQLKKIVTRAYAIAPNLIGEQAPPLEMKDSLMRPLSLYTTKGKYTILVFWDPTCGHCKIEVPKLDSAYKASWKKKGVTMIGFRTEGTKEQWEDFIKTNHLDGWIHAWDPDNQSNYHRLYDVYSTPVVYLLDEKKKILAKRLGVEQLSDFLEHLETKGRTANK
jgi:peroxiredoxin